MKYKLGVRATLFLLVLVSLAPVLFVVVESSISEQHNAVENAKTSLHGRVQLRATVFEQELERMRDVVTAISQALPIRSPNGDDCNGFLRKLNSHMPQYSAMAFADANGTLVCRSGFELGAFDPRDEKYSPGAGSRGRLSLGKYQLSDIRGKHVIVFSLPVYGSAGDLRGVQHAAVDFASSQGQMSAPAVPPGMSDVITDTDGIVLASAGERMQELGKPLRDAFLAQAVQKQLAVAGSGTDAGGTRWLYAVRPVSVEGGAALVLSSMISSESVLQAAIQRLQQQLAIVLGIALAASSLAWWIGSRMLAVPMDRLLAKIRALEHGGPASIQRRDIEGHPVSELRHMDHEIEQLACVLQRRSAQRDLAIAELHTQKSALERSEQRYRAQFDASPQPMWVFDSASMAFLVVNDAAVAHYGYSRDEFMKMTLADIRPAEDIPLLLDTMNGSTSESGDVVRRRHLRKNGEVIHVEIATHALDWAGRAARMMIVYDVTSGVMAEQAWQRLHATLEHRVAQRTRDLKLINDELEAFSYSASHDLKGPLHIADGFCAALLERHGSELSAPASHYLGRIRAGMQQMSSLVDDLLTFARTGRAPMSLQHADLARLAGKSVARLRERFPDRRVNVEIDECLEAVCDPSLFAIVFDNLIGNAWKFTSRTPEANIRVSRVAGEAAEICLVVSDNGAGFDMAQSEKLFKAFQRLHSTAEYEGTGIGLALVYRIVHRHGGRIWAEAAPDKGAHFYISLPQEVTEA